MSTGVIIVIVAVIVAIPGIGWAVTALRMGGYRESFALSEVYRDRLSKELRDLTDSDAKDDKRQAKIVEALNARIVELEEEVDRRRRPGDARRRLRLLSDAKAETSDNHPQDQ